MVQIFAPIGAIWAMTQAADPLAAAAICAHIDDLLCADVRSRRARFFPSRLLPAVPIRPFGRSAAGAPAGPGRQARRAACADRVERRLRPRARQRRGFASTGPRPSVLRLIPKSRRLEPPGFVRADSPRGRLPGAVSPDHAKTPEFPS